MNTRLYGPGVTVRSSPFVNAEYLQLARAGRGLQARAVRAVLSGLVRRLRTGLADWLADLRGARAA